MGEDARKPDSVWELESLIQRVVRTTAAEEGVAPAKANVYQSALEKWGNLTRVVVTGLVFLAVFTAGAIFSDAIRNNYVFLYVLGRDPNVPDSSEVSWRTKSGHSGRPGEGGPVAPAPPRVKVTDSFKPVKWKKEPVIVYEDWREKLENQLRDAKAIIDGLVVGDELQPEDDPMLADIYFDLDKFRRSYHEMEKRFRIYVYEEGDRPLIHDGPTVDIYATEGLFIKNLVPGSRFVTNDPHLAHLFFLPYSTVYMVRDLWKPPSRSMKPIADYIVNYVDKLASLHPFWNLTAGRDHFFVTCHDWGNAVARDHDMLRRNAIKVVCVAAENEEFVPGKDVSLPEIYVKRGRYPGHLGGHPPEERDLLAFFAGQMVGKVRPVLMKHWQDKDPSILVFEHVPKEVLKKRSYEEHMKSSKFCLCPAGYEVNSPRIVEAISYECVPVIIADGFHKPFADVLDWDTFSITVKEAEIPNLKEILEGISYSSYVEMQGRLKYARRHFIFNTPVEKYDVFHMVLHSLWVNKLRTLDELRDPPTEDEEVAPLP